LKAWLSCPGSSLLVRRHRACPGDPRANEVRRVVRANGQNKTLDGRGNLHGSLLMIAGASPATTSSIKQTQLHIPAACSCPGAARSLPSEGARKAGRRLAPVALCERIAHATHRGKTGEAGNVPTFPARWFTSYAALTLETNSFCLHRFAD